MVICGGENIDPREIEDVPAGDCACSLSGYKRPMSLIVLDAVPKNAVGKIDKAVLRARHAAAPSF